MDFPSLGRVLCEASWLESICPIGRGSGMTLCRRILELALDLLVISRVRVVIRVILLLWIRERRRPSSGPKVCLMFNAC
jgi:hypothetical protein